MQGGGAASIKGGAENKRKEGKEARELGLVLDRVGLETGRVGRGVYKGWDPFFPHFFLFFLSLLPLESKTLSSLSSLSFEFSGKRWVVGDGSDAAVGRRWRRRRRSNSFFLFFFVLTHLLSLLYSFLGLKLPKSLLKGLDLKKKERKFILLFFPLCFGSSTVMLELETVVLRFGRVCVLTGLVVLESVML